MLSQDHQILTTIRWEAAGKRSGLLQECGFAHGFDGRAEGEPAEAAHVRQVHGVAIVEASGPGRHEAAADGVLTAASGRIIAVKTADCVPLLLADRDRKLAVAVHAGWRGLTAGIVRGAVATVEERGVPASRLVAAVGPCIRVAAFEVGVEVVEALGGKACGLTSTQFALCSQKGRADRWHVDLQAAAALILVNAGIPPRSIAVVQGCTFTQNDVWHSARRHGPGFGSNWSWIQL